MSRVHPTIVFLRNVLLLALLGVAGLFLAGPILAVLSALLGLALVIGVFAVVGFLFWAFFEMVLHGPRMAGTRVAEVGHIVAGRLRSTGRLLAAAVRGPARALYQIAAVAGRVPLFLLRTTWSASWLAAEMGLLATMGVVIGGGVGLLLGVLNQNVEEAVPTNALAGGAIALVAGLVMAIRDRRRSVVRA